jgi:hypothetical protein
MRVLVDTEQAQDVSGGYTPLGAQPQAANAKCLEFTAASTFSDDGLADAERSADGDEVDDGRECQQFRP